ncbi:MAG: enoyl-CoA hydratase/isomerase family protein, partial [Myxococcaceae bacterium]
TLLYEGRMYDSEQARQLGLVDEVVPADQLLAQAHVAANRLGGREPAAFASIKRELRRAAAEVIAQRDEASVREFADIWYSPETWRQVQEIKIR